MKYDPTEEIFVRYYIRKQIKEGLKDLIDSNSLNEKEKNNILKDAEHITPDMYLVLIAQKNLEIEKQRLNIEQQNLQTQKEILAEIKKRNTKNEIVETTEDEHSQTLQKQL